MILVNSRIRVSFWYPGSARIQGRLHEVRNGCRNLEKGARCGIFGRSRTGRLSRVPDLVVV